MAVELESHGRKRTFNVLLVEPDPDPKVVHRNIGDEVYGLFQ